MFELALPWVLFFLPLPLLLWFVLPKASIRLPAALKIPFFNAILPIVNQRPRFWVAQAQMGLFFVIWGLLLLAAAGPRWIGEPLPLERQGRNIMLVLDLSGSMELPDMIFHGRPVSRLTVVKHAAEEFVRQRVGDRIGLILFGARAYLQTPLTYDRQTVLLRIEDATVGLAGQTTSIGDALGLAVKRLQDVPAKGRMIILLTDGANNSGILAPLKAAELAKLDGIKVYTIGLGTESDPRALRNLFLNVNASSDLDEETLQEVAKITGGRYFRATDVQSLHEIYETINQLETVTQEQATIRPQHDYYPWPLAFAFLLFCYWLANKAKLFAGLNRAVNRKVSIS
ncbi:vWA domain-containing protein [Legionella clemsonensis]|uniref:von Willebrand factor type A domain protein n=1 Tax=Legionella clemsonensis TaxID=1867846 RepID=A0A222NYN5_9GAMM|nr:VWA domain-containing protein [Legionella clemsonensis]ASQ44707.1 von Willebrand factor type A domain protein [Legionella clemsonensis]